MATPVGRMRLTIEVLPLIADNAHGPYQAAALAAFKGRKFALPVQMEHTIAQVWSEIDERYKRNYLTPQEAAVFTIKKLQDAYDCDLDTRDTVGALFEGEPNVQMRVIKVVPSFVDRGFSVPPTSHLRPVAAHTPLSEASEGRGSKRRRIEETLADIVDTDPDRDRPMTSTEPQSDINGDPASKRRRLDKELSSFVDVDPTLDVSVATTENEQDGDQEREEHENLEERGSPELGLPRQQSIPETPVHPSEVIRREVHLLNGARPDSSLKSATKESVQKEVNLLNRLNTVNGSRPAPLHSEPGHVQPQSMELSATPSEAPRFKRRPGRPRKDSLPRRGQPPGYAPRRSMEFIPAKVPTPDRVLRERKAVRTPSVKEVRKDKPKPQKAQRKRRLKAEAMPSQNEDAQQGAQLGAQPGTQKDAQSGAQQDVHQEDESQPRSIIRKPKAIAKPRPAKNLQGKGASQPAVPKPITSQEHATVAESPDSERSSPAVSRRPARFLTHSPTPEKSSSEDESATSRSGTRSQAPSSKAASDKDEGESEDSSDDNTSAIDQSEQEEQNQGIVAARSAGDAPLTTESTHFHDANLVPDSEKEDEGRVAEMRDVKEDDLQDELIKNNAPSVTESEQRDHQAGAEEDIAPSVNGEQPNEGASSVPESEQGDEEEVVNGDEDQEHFASSVDGRQPKDDESSTEESDEEGNNDKRKEGVQVDGINESTGRLNGKQSADDGSPTESSEDEDEDEEQENAKEANDADEKDEDTDKDDDEEEKEASDVEMADVENALGSSPPEPPIQPSSVVQVPATQSQQPPTLQPFSLPRKTPVPVPPPRARGPWQPPAKQTTTTRTSSIAVSSTRVATLTPVPVPPPRRSGAWQPSQASQSAPPQQTPMMPSSPAIVASSSQSVSQLAASRRPAARTKFPSIKQQLNAARATPPASQTKRFDPRTSDLSKLAKPPAKGKAGAMLFAASDSDSDENSSESSSSGNEDGGAATNGGLCSVA